MKKSINDLTRQRNGIQEWLTNSGAWKRHPRMYQQVENAWRRYVTNIEIHAGKALDAEGFHSAFANKKYNKDIYKTQIYEAYNNKDVQCTGRHRD